MTISTGKMGLNTIDLGWTKEDQDIWRQRQMRPHTIRYRYQFHIKEFDTMVNLTKIPLRPGKAKLVALQFLSSGNLEAYRKHMGINGQLRL